jgi:hypothetical protein
VQRALPVMNGPGPSAARDRASDIANAYIDFSKMTCSVVAVITDVVRDGKPVIEFGFNSNGPISPNEQIKVTHQAYEAGVWFCCKVCSGSSPRPPS